MSKREEIINSFYNNINEDTRLLNSRHGQMEYITTMNYIHRFANEKAKILEIGAGTGRYSIALVKEGYEVTAVELVEQNLTVLKENSKDLENIHSYQGDAMDLERFADNQFDITMVLGPLYHLYSEADVNRALDEAIRVTKQGGTILVAFLSVYAIMFNNYFQGNFQEGYKENFADNGIIKHFEEQVFTGYDIVEFEQLFEQKNTQCVTIAALDSVLESAEMQRNFNMSDKDMELYVQFHLSTCEKRELLGSSSHLLYICTKNNK